MDFDRLFQYRVEHTFHPLQVLDHFGSISAHTQDLAKPFVQGAVGAVTIDFVLDDPDWHPRGHNARHRTHRVVVVAGVKA